MEEEYAEKLLEICRGHVDDWQKRVALLQSDMMKISKVYDGQIVDVNAEEIMVLERWINELQDTIEKIEFGNA